MEKELHKLQLKTIVASGEKPQIAMIETPSASSEDNYFHKHSKHVCWGDDDDTPNQWVERLEKNTTIWPRLDFQAKAMYGSGPMVGEIKIIDGAEVWVPIRPKEWVELMRDMQIEKKLIRAALYRLVFNQFWVEFYINNVRKSVNTKIVTAVAHKPLIVREGLREKSGRKKGKVLYSYVNPDFGTDKYNPKKSVPIPKIDTFYKPHVWLRKELEKHYKIKAKNKRHRIPRKWMIKYDGPCITQNHTYSKPMWTTAIDSGWMEYEEQRMEAKRSLMKHAVTVKYVVYVDPRYWGQLFGETCWQKMGESERTKKQQEWLNGFNAFLTGAKNSGKSIVLPSIYEQVLKRNNPLVEIKALEQPKMDINIDGSAESRQNQESAVGLDSSLSSAGESGGGIGAGSGSDKRVSWNITETQLKSYQDDILDFLGFIRDYNGLPQSWVFRFRNTNINTLNTGVEKELKE